MPRLAALARTSTFQLTLTYSLLFGLSVLLLLLFFYWSTIGLLVRENDATLKAEITGLAEQYIEHGLDRLAQVIAHRMRTDASGTMLYLFATRDNEPLAGNLAAWPRGRADADGWLEFRHRLADGREVPARARVYLLRDGLHLLVGRNVEQLEQLRRIFNRALLGGGGLVVALATLGGLVMGSRLVARVGRLEAATGAIIAGDLDRRLERSGSNDEFDLLAGHVNAMLDRLQALLAAVRHVSDNIAHDLRTPLTRLRNRIELAARTAPAPLAGELEACVADADQLLATFSSLLRIARIESRSYDAHLAEVTPATLVEDAIELYAGVAQEADVALDAEVLSATTVLGDRDLLFQAIVNLVDNALKFAPQGSRVVVRVAAVEDGVAVEVADRGPGIPASEHGRVVQRFARLDQSRSLPGAGLGLSLVHAVAELHEGSLRFADNAPGLRAILELPRRTEPRQAKAATFQLS